MSETTPHYSPPPVHGCIGINSGHLFNIANPDPDDFRISDIAHALGNLCRFGGHVRNFYSIAQHSVYVSYLVPHHKRKAALLHDGTEAYMVDLPRPVKRMFPEYSVQEKILGGKLAMAFGLPVDAFEDQDIHQADDLMLALEIAALTVNPEVYYATGVARPDRTIRSVDSGFKLWSPMGAKGRFLLRYNQLIEEELEQAA